MENTTATKTGLAGKPLDEIIQRFYGNLSQWPVEPDGINWTQSQIVKVCTHIQATGDCLWHAQTIVFGWDSCHCMNCQRGGRQ